MADEATQPFEREERYIVFKKSHLTQRQLGMLEKLITPPGIPPANWHDDHTLPTVECVIVESDWPEYETVWNTIEARMAGQSRPLPLDELRQFAQNIFNGLDTGMITIDSPADETLANVLQRGRRALATLTE